MNLNNRALTLSAERVSSVIDALEKAKDSLSNNKLELINRQLEDFETGAKLSKGDAKGRRRIDVAGILCDTQGYLVATGCCATGFKYTYTLDFTHLLPLAFSLAFNQKESDYIAPIRKLCEAHNISQEYFAFMLLNIENFDTGSDITVGDLCELPGVEEFFSKLSIEKSTKGSHILSNIEGIDLTNFIEVSDSTSEHFSIALMFQLLFSINRVIVFAVVELNDKGYDGVILSKDAHTITFVTNSIMSPMIYYNTRQEKVALVPRLIYSK